MALRGSERPQIKTATQAKPMTGPRDKLKVLIVPLVIMAIVAAIIFYFGVSR